MCLVLLVYVLNIVHNHGLTAPLCADDMSISLHVDACLGRCLVVNCYGLHQQHLFLVSSLWIRPNLSDEHCTTAGEDQYPNWQMSAFKYPTWLPDLAWLLTVS